VGFENGAADGVTAAVEANGALAALALVVAGENGVVGFIVGGDGNVEGIA